MALFNITDSETGMKVRISGDNAPEESDMPQLFAAARKSAAGQLSDGSYARDPSFRKIDKSEQRDRIHKLSAAALGTSVDEVDIHSGSSFKERVILDNLPDDPSRLEYMEKKYGADNVDMLDVGGTAKMFYRDPKSKKMTMVDEQGTSFADFTADISGAVVETAGAVAAGVGAVALTGATGGLALPLIAAGGAAAGHFGTGLAKDVAAEALTGQELEVGQHAGQRAKEAAVGFGADLLTAGAGRFIGKPLLKSVGKTQAAQNIMDSVKGLNKRFGGELEELPSMTKGVKGRERAARVAGETGGASTRRRFNNIDEVERMTRVVDGTEAPANAASAIQRMQARTKAGYDTDIAEAQMLGGNISEAYKTRSAQAQQNLQSQLDNEIAGIRLPRDFNPEVAGQQLQEGVKAQFDTIVEATRKKYQGGLSEMQRKGTSTSGSGFSNAISRASSKAGGVENIEGDFVEALSSTTGKQLERSMKNHLDELANSGKRVSYQEVHDVVQKFKNKMNFDPAVNPTTEQIAARHVVDELTPLLKDMRKTNPKADGMIKKADEFFKAKNLPFRNKDIASLMKKDVTQTRLAPSDVANNIFKAPRNVRNLLKNAGGMRAPMKKQLANMYLDAMGTKLDFNPAIAKELFPEDVVKALTRIKTLRERLNVSAGKIKDGDIEAMVNGLSGSARKEAEAKLAKKLAAEHRASKLIKSNGLIKKIATGDAPMPSHPREFAKDVLAAKDTKDIKGFVERLEGDPDALSGLRGGVVENFREAINFGGDLASRTSAKADEIPLWKAGDVEKLLAGPKGAKYEAAMGKEWVKDWIDLDRALKGSEITGTPIHEQVRAVFTTGTGLLIVAAGLPKWAYGRAMNALGGSKVMRPFLRNVEQNPETMKQILPYLMSTSEGMAALIEEGRNDPEFAELIEQQMAQRASQ